MIWPLALFFAWVVVAQVIAMLPSRRNHWPQAYALIAAGVPILGAVVFAHGPLVGLLVLIAGGSVLRWPVRYLAAWLVRRVGGEAGAERLKRVWHSMRGSQDV